MENFDPETAENNPDIEKQWAVVAFEHAEVYARLITSTDTTKLRLTRMDDEIYEDFQTTFPDLDVERLKEYEDFKSEEAKARWRPWLMKYEKKVDKFNFGTLLRLNAADPELREDNMIFGMCLYKSFI